MPDEHVSDVSLQLTYFISDLLINSSVFVFSCEVRLSLAAVFSHLLPLYVLVVVKFCCMKRNPIASLPVSCRICTQPSTCTGAIECARVWHTWHAELISTDSSPLFTCCTSSRRTILLHISTVSQLNRVAYHADIISNLCNPERGPAERRVGQPKFQQEFA
jgi:hypothetical protein